MSEQPDTPQTPIDNTEKPKTSDENSTINPVLVVFLFVPLLGILTAFIMIANDMRQSDNALAELPSINPSSLVNLEAPEFTLNDLNGNPVSISDYEGQILFLNFWQTTCPPCIEEMPDFLDFVEDQPDDLTWLTVNFNETDEQVREFFAEYDFIGIPTVMDYNSDVRYQYGVYGAPVTFVIDPDGVIRYMNIGKLTYDEMTSLADSVRESDV